MPGGRYGVEIRSAQAADAPELARLLASVGVAATARDAADRLEAVRDRPDAAVLVATGWSGLAGVAALHWAPVLTAPRPVATMTVLVVGEEDRRNGIGRLLLKAASQAARAGGCDTMTMAMAADGAAFCRATGFEEGKALFTRPLRRRG